MKSYRETITAGRPLSLPVGGRVLYIQNSPEGQVLDIEFVRRSAESQKVERVGKGFKASPTVPFEGVRISTTVTQTIDFIITEGDIEVAFNEDATIVGNANAQAIPMRTVPGQPLEVLFGGTVAPVFGTANIDNTDAQAIPMKQKIGAVFTTKNEALAVIVDHAAAVINTGAAQLLISDATYRRLRLKNAHASARVALGGAAVTMANAAIILEPGDIWTEDDAAGAAWYATSDTAAADVRVMGLK